MDIKNARIPLDKEGAELMYAPHSLEAKFKTNLLSNIAKIMNVARLTGQCRHLTMGQYQPGYASGRQRDHGDGGTDAF